jgi:hypothetical protein
MTLLYSCKLDSSELLDSNKALIYTSILLPKESVNQPFFVDLRFKNTPIICYSEILSHWHCQSVSWLKLTFWLTQSLPKCAGIADLTLNIFAAAPSTATCEQTKLEENVDFNAVAQDDSLKLDIICKNDRVNGSWLVADSQGLQPQIQSLTQENKKLITTNDELFGQQITTKAVLKFNDSRILNFEAQYLVCPTALAIVGRVKIHNPAAAIHKAGKWDLGDDSSINISNLKLQLTFPLMEKMHIEIEGNNQKTLQLGDRYALTQISSGGDNWQSPVHVDANNTLPFAVCGYTENYGGKVSSSPRRASPKIVIENAQTQINVELQEFWQRFPSQIELENNVLTLDFLPQLEYCHELQGGESTTHEFTLDFSSATKSFIKTHVLAASNRLTARSSLGFSINNPKNLDELSFNALYGPNNFFIKRELVDEFGWRNFGELYADHETASYAGQNTFVSHYNNQYDPIFGFLKQYLVDGDKHWFELANDLAKHVKDIDIYQTSADKAEYNGGLFWHTDHYLEAHTSTHRSYSKYQDSNAYQDHAGGGGPGGQHCYTSGLKLHYLLTGELSSKQAVLTLSSWISNVYEGSNTCLELLLAFKNRHSAGTKNHFTGQYPLDRGTANYIIALLDSFELSQSRAYLARVEHIITNTVHPNENISLRNLHDVEGTWFYTVFLQAVYAFLRVKQELNEFDETFYYARDSLLNFADWMVVNEAPYLDNPDILEYPNDTWTAQDLRKANIFAAAAYYTCSNQQVYLDKAVFFENEVATRLKNSKTKTYTRIMVLILQNCGVVDYFKSLTKPTELRPYKQAWPKADYEDRNLLVNFIKLLGRRLWQLSIKNEISWLKKRLK